MNPRKDKKYKYSHDDRKCIAQSIENLKNDEDYVAIFEILTEDDSNYYTQNSNGVFLNLSVVSNQTLGKIKKYLEKIKKAKYDQNEISIDTIPNTGPSKNNRQYKLSNYEKNIIKQRNLKKIMNQDDDYEKLEFTNKMKNIKPKKSSKLNADY